MAKGIYKITNDRTGEVYIGQTNNLYFREQQHKEDLANGTHHNRGMQQDYNRGDTFSFEVLEYVDGSRSDLHEREKAQIRNHNSFYAGYNQTPGGEYDQYKGSYEYGGGRKYVSSGVKHYPTYNSISHNKPYTKVNDSNFKPNWSCAPRYDNNYYERNKHRGNANASYKRPNNHNKKIFHDSGSCSEVRNKISSENKSSIKKSIKNKITYQNKTIIGILALISILFVSLLSIMEYRNIFLVPYILPAIFLIIPSEKVKSSKFLAIISIVSFTALLVTNLYIDSTLISDIFYGYFDYYYDMQYLIEFILCSIISFISLFCTLILFVSTDSKISDNSSKGYFNLFKQAILYSEKDNDGNNISKSKILSWIIFIISGFLFIYIFTNGYSVEIFDVIISFMLLGSICASITFIALSFLNFE